METRQRKQTDENSRVGSRIERSEIQGDRQVKSSRQKDRHRIKSEDRQEKTRAAR